MRIGLIFVRATVTMNDRPKIPKSIQTDILIESKRRCCICYGLNRDLNIQKGQIAHVDHNRDNNDPMNLVFLCLKHHDEYDSKSSQSKSFLDSEIRHYKSELSNYWSIPEKSLPTDITKDLYQELSMIAHFWKNEYMDLYPGHFAKIPSNDSRKDVWDLFQDVAQHEFSESEWKKYNPLFSSKLPVVVDKLQKLTLVWGEYLDDVVKHRLLKLCSQLENQARIYPLIKLIANSGEPGDYDILFSDHIKGTLRLLGEFSREMDSRRKNVA